MLLSPTIWVSKYGMNIAYTNKIPMIVYPKEITLKDKKRIVLRPLEERDIERLIAFFSKIPSSDLIIYKDDVSRWETVESWFISPKYTKVFQLVALKDEEIVAKGTLHQEGLYWKNTAEIKLIVHPEYRGKGLGSQMFKVLLTEGLNHRFEKIVVRFTSDNTSFIRILDRFGFKPEAVLRCYVKDEESGQYKDLVVATYSFEDWIKRFELYRFLYGK